MRTVDLARRFGVHPNTVRLYEAWGFLPPIPRDHAGRRVFTRQHVAQMQLARSTLHHAPPSGSHFKQAYKDIVWTACAGHVPRAITQARTHLARVLTARDHATLARAFVLGAIPAPITQLANPPLSIQRAASVIGVSVPVLRRWETWGILRVPRNPRNNYRWYGPHELGWLLVVHTLRHAGYTLVACRRLIAQASVIPPLPTARSQYPLGNALSACIALFSDHAAHTNRVLDLLHHLTTVIEDSERISD